jgi:hypothetical protein
VKQHRNEIGTVLASSKIAVHELNIEVAAADVEDDRQFRPKGGHVGVILLGPDAEIRRPAAPASPDRE